MAYSAIDNSSLHCTNKQFTGNNSDAHAITGLGFRPDMVWFKNSNSTQNWRAFDVVRGATYRIVPNENTVNGAETSQLQAFGSDGFTVGADASVNGSGNTMNAYCWKAAGSQGSSNTDGTINTTYTSVNATAGFSISQYTGTGSNATFGHGLGKKPEWVFIKNLSTNTDWRVYFDREGSSKSHALNTSGSSGSGSDYWNSTATTSSLVSIGTNTGLNASGSTYIAWCFAPIVGYSKMGKYRGNGSATNGTMVYCGFKPSIIMIKDADNAGENWFLFDDKRPGYNFNANLFNINDTGAETTSGANGIDILSNGFKMRSTNNGTNRADGGFNYLAFGQPLVGSNNVPSTAR